MICCLTLSTGALSSEPLCRRAAHGLEAWRTRSGGRTASRSSQAASSATASITSGRSTCAGVTACAHEG